MGLSLKHSVRHAVLAATILLSLLVIAQVAQLVSLASAAHAALGWLVAVLLLAALAWVIGVPVVAYMRLDPALIPPTEPSGPAHDAFVSAYLAVCKRNPRLAGQPLETEADLKSALEHLEKEAEKVANRTASTVFLATAVSQYGSLDALIVAVTQARMVWDVAHVFHQRPSTRQLGYLYSNVLATALIASRLDQVDLSEYLQPVLVGVLGQGIVSTPGVAMVSNHVSNAVFQGSVNAFLTLRVAMVAIAYSRATLRPNRNAVRRSAIIRAGHLVVRTVTGGSAQVAKAFAVAAGKTVGGAVVGAGHAVMSGVTTVGQGVVTAGQKVGTGAVTVGHAVGTGMANAGTTLGHTAKSAGGAVVGLGSGVGGHVRSMAERANRRRGRDAPTDLPEAGADDQAEPDETGAARSIPE